MRLILIRHAERRHDMLEGEAQLTNEGQRKSADVAIALLERKIED